MDDLALVVIFGVTGLAFLIFPRPVAVLIGTVNRINARRWNADKINEIAALPEEYRMTAINDLSELNRYLYYSEHSRPFKWQLRIMGALLCIAAIALIFQ